MRERWERELEMRGAPALHAELARRAPWAAEGIDPNDRQRIVRAHELLDAGELEPPEGPSQLWTDEVRHPTLLAGLTMEREALYARIDARVEEMVAAGAREEVLRAHAAGASETARKALGFDELLAGDVEAMQRRTRNYARRQLTWMRKLAGVRMIDVTGRSAEASPRRSPPSRSAQRSLARYEDSRLQPLELLLRDRASRAQLVELVQLVDRRGPATERMYSSLASCICFCSAIARSRIPPPRTIR